jgi:TrmH family RNA methyltransferase
MLSIKDIKLLIKQKKARDSQGLFVTEGKKLFEEAPKDRIVQVLMTASYEKAHLDVISQIPENVPVLSGMEDDRFSQVADTKSPQGILTVIRREEGSAQEVMEAEKPFFVLLEDLQDPGNVGTILRTAEAAGVTAVFLTRGCADLYSPKTIRSTMGSIFRVPHFTIESAPDLIRELKEKHIPSFAAHLKGTCSYTDCAFSDGCLIVIGNEGSGITDETADACSSLMKIPMEGRVESLNAAMAAGIVMYEVKRQKGGHLYA